MMITRLGGALTVLFTLASLVGGQSRDQPNYTLVISPAVGPSDRVATTTLHLRADGADRMRIGNTKGELRHAEWQPYQRQIHWYLRGQQPQPLRTPPGGVALLHHVDVYIEVEDLPPCVQVDACARLILTGRAPPRVDGLSRFPLVHTIGDPRASDILVSFDFTAPQHWASYWDVRYWGNLFWPVSISHTGGSGGRDTSYAWVDDSRFLVDPPESPNSVLWALVYWRDLIRSDLIDRSSDAVSVRNTWFLADLRGQDLDLQGGSIHVWVENADGRWHQTAHPLQAGITWTTNAVLLTDTPTEWVRTYDRHGSNPVLNLDQVTSIGMSFLYFPRDTPPTGRIDFDNVILRAFDQ